MGERAALLADVEPVAAVLERPHGLLEAPNFGANGELVYSDVIAGGLWALSPAGVTRALLERRRGIGGALPASDGGWVLSGRTVLHLAPDGTQRELLGEREGVVGYNDLASTPEGGLLAGALRYRPLAGEPERSGQLLELTPAGEVRVLSEEAVWPNGIGVSPDGGTVYLCDYARRAVLALPRGGGRAVQLARSPRGSADGLALDAEGGIWIALGEGAGVARLCPDGSLDGIVDLPASFVSSICFGGEDMRDVLITTADNERRPELGGTLLRARSSVPGLRRTPLHAPRTP